MKNKLKICLLLIACVMIISISTVTATNVTCFKEMNTEIQAGNNVTLTNNITGLDGINDGIIINGKTTVNGNGYTIDANGSGRFFKISDNSVLTLKNIILKNGYIYDYGGAIYCESSNLILNNVLFYNNTAFIGGAVCVNNSNIICNDVIFNFNHAYIGGALTILSHDTFDSRKSEFINNYALYAENIFSRGDIILYSDSLQVSLTNKFVISFDDKKSTTGYFSDNKITVVRNDGLIDYIKTINTDETFLSEDDFKDMMDGIVFGKTYYVSNINELNSVFHKLNQYYGALFNYKSKYRELNFKNSNNITAHIVLLPGVYNASKRLSFTFENASMNISIDGNGQFIDCSNLNDTNLFYVTSNSILVLKNLTICNAGFNNELESLIYNRGILVIDNVNFTGNIIKNSRVETKNIITGIKFNGESIDFNYKTITSNKELNGYLIYSIDTLYIGDNVNFINNSVNNDLIHNCHYCIMSGYSMNFINNSVSKGSIFENYQFAFIDVKYMNFINNKNCNIDYGIILNNGFIGIYGENYTFINNKGKILNQKSDLSEFNNNTLNITEIPCDLLQYLFSTNSNLSSTFHYVSNAMNMKVNNLLFENNYCEEDESPIYVQKGTMSIIVNNLISKNNYADNGGLIYTCGGILNLYGYNMSFYNNRGVYGGVIYNDGGFCNIISLNTTFMFNNANKGGALYVNTGIINMVGNFDFKNNTATFDICKDYYVSPNSFLFINNHPITYITGEVKTNIQDYISLSNIKMDEKEVFDYIRNISLKNSIKSIEGLNKNSTSNNISDLIDTNLFVENVVKNSINLFMDGNYKSYSASVDFTNFDNNHVSNSTIHYQYIENTEDLMDFHKMVINDGIKWDILYLYFANNTVFEINPEDYDKCYLIGNFANQIFIEGNNCTIKNIYSPEKYQKGYKDQLYFIEIDSKQDVTINNLNFDSFQSGVIKNSGFCTVNNCTFKNNDYRNDVNNKITTYDNIYNTGCLSCINCSFINLIKAIYNKEDSWCILYDCAFFNNTYDIWDDVMFSKVNLIFNNTNKTINNFKIHVDSHIGIKVLMGVGAVFIFVASAIAGYYVADEFVFLIVAKNMENAVITGIISSVIIGAIGGAVVGFVLGMSLSAIINAMLHNKINFQTVWNYGKYGVIIGAIGGAIGGSIVGVRVGNTYRNLYSVHQKPTQVHSYPSGYNPLNHEPIDQSIEEYKLIIERTFY